MTEPREQEGRQPPFGPSAPDTIDLVAVIANLWARKWLIVASTAVFALAGIVYALVTTPVYRAEVVLASSQDERGSGINTSLGGLASLAGINLGNQGDSKHALATLRSRAFVESFILDNNLLPVLFASRWDEEKSAWIGDDPLEHPDIRDAVRFFTTSVRTVNVNPETGLITLAIHWIDAELAAKWVEQLVARINDQLRNRDLDDAKRQLDYLQGQLQNASLVELRQAISRLIEGQMQTIMLAQAKSEYAFTVIDPPRVPDRPARPRKVLIVAIMTFCGGLVGILLAVLHGAIRGPQSMRAD